MSVATPLRSTRRRRPQASEERLALVEHLIELRRRLLISVGSVVVASAVAFIFRSTLLHFLAAPYCHTSVSHRLGNGDSCVLIVNGVLDGFSVALRVSIYAGVLISAPVWLWHIWRFVTPGLHRGERRATVTFITSALVMFGAGATLAYLTLGKGLEFLLNIAGDDITPLLTVTRYLSFLFAMVMVFGLAFEFPVLLVLLNRLGVVTSQRLRSWRRQAIMAVFVFAAVATPSQDPFTMTALALPMVLFYEVAIIIARVHDSRAARREADAELARWLGADDDATPFDSLARPF